jgi:hypothetical protein
MVTRSGSYAPSSGRPIERLINGKLCVAGCSIHKHNDEMHYGSIQKL